MIGKRNGTAGVLDARGRRWLAGLIGVLLITGLACSALTPGVDQALLETQVALNVQGTGLALQAEGLTDQAGQPAGLPVMPTIAVPATAEPAALPATAAPPALPPTAEPPPPALPQTDGSYVRGDWDPAAGWGAPDILDDFDGGNKLFNEGSNAWDSNWYGSDGRYHMTYNARGRWVWNWGDPKLDQFYMDVVVINGDNCVDRDSAGLMYLGNIGYDMGFMFGVSCEGKFWVGGTGGVGYDGLICAVKGTNAWDCDLISTVTRMRESEYINAGPGAANRLGVMYVGQQITLYINGHEVHSFWNLTLDDPPPSVNWDKGYPGLYLGAGQPDRAAVSFDDLSIWLNP